MQTCIYGPVPSRRLGRSLGIDLLPAKICSYDCIYCQLGQTSGKTIRQRPYRRAETVLAQLKDTLAGGVTADCITIAGSGEPTLNSEIGAVIEGIKEEIPLPVAVLTNSSLLSQADVRQALLAADIVVPSLDAYNPALFDTINRPHSAITFNPMLEGLIAFSKDFPGRLWLEIFILAGINASAEDAARFRPLVDRIAPADIYVNTAVRPPREAFAKEADEDMIDGFYQVLGAKRQSDTIFSTGAGIRNSDIGTAVLEMAARRPVTLTDMAAGLEEPIETVREQVKALVAENRLEKIEKTTATYFRTRTDHAKP